MKKQKRRDIYGSPRWSAEFLDCSMPMTFDQYNLCSYQCQYCFSFYQRIHNNNYETNQIKWVNVDKFKKIFLMPESSQFGEYIKKRIPMQWGGLSEPFDLLEPKYKIGLQIMKFLREIDYPVSFSTKSTWFVKNKEYADVIKGAKNFHFKWSIITLDEEKARKIEVGVPTPMERLEAMGEVAKWGTAGVNLRLRPFMIGISDPTHIKLIEEAGKRGAKALTTEFFCLEARADDRVKRRYTLISKVCGFNLYDFYKRNSTTQGYLRLNYEIKRKYVEEMREACKKADMAFLISDAHHKEKCALANGCRWGSCCGVPNDKYFGNYAKCQFTEAITIAKEKGEVRFSDITKNETAYLKGTRVRTVLHAGDMADHFHKSLYDYMRWSWNHPAKSANSPYRYFAKILVPTGIDKNGDVIYKFNQKKYDQ